VCIGVAFAIAVGGPQMIGAFANGLFHILHVKAPMLRGSIGAVTWLTNRKRQRFSAQHRC
jgi:hypothetical protein